MEDENLNDYKQLHILLKKEINIKKLITQCKFINAHSLYSTSLYNIYRSFKKHVNKNIIKKLICIAQDLEKQKIFSIQNFNKYLQNNSIEINKPNQKNGIKILTIHAAKGLESKTVILINNILEKKSYSKNHIEEENDLKESTRLLYVALTRTKSKLIIIEK